MAAPKKKAQRRTRVHDENPVAAFFHRLSWGWVAFWLGAIILVGGAIAAVNNTLPIIEPGVLAHRGYVRDYTDTTTKGKVEPIAKRFEDYYVTNDAFRIEQTMEIAKLNLNTISSQIDAAKKEVEMYPNSVAAKESLARLSQLRDATRKRIEDYEAALFTKRSGR